MATADFILGTTCRSTARKSLGVWIAALATTVTLAGCSSQPETADIQKDLTEAYACPILVLSEVKKVDGAANGKSYDVTFTHTMSIKGGAEAAAKLFAEWSHLAGQQLPAKMALEQAQATGNVAAITQAEQRLNAMDARLVQIMPCETLEAVTRLQVMRAKADEAVKTGQNAAPVSIKVRGTGRMGKAESGWHFAGMPAFSTVEIVTANATYPRFKSEATTSTSAPSEARRLIGKVRAGSTDSCLEVSVSGESKCYTLPGEPEVASRIFSACQDGDMCAITGQFDDKNEKLIQFGKAERVAP